jgi:hypothetical protein
VKTFSAAQVYDGSRPSYKNDVYDSKFCLAPTGAGWGIRIMEVILMGCLPVIIQDNVTQPLEEVIPYEKFSVRVAEADMERLPQILEAITSVSNCMASNNNSELDVLGFCVSDSSIGFYFIFAHYFCTLDPCILTKNSSRGDSSQRIVQVTSQALRCEDNL